MLEEKTTVGFWPSNELGAGLLFEAFDRSVDLGVDEPGFTTAAAFFAGLFSIRTVGELATAFLGRPRFFGAASSGSSSSMVLTRWDFQYTGSYVNFPMALVLTSGSTSCSSVPSLRGFFAFGAAVLSSCERLRDP